MVIDVTPDIDVGSDPRDLRELAKLARRTAERLSQVADRMRVNNYASELEQRAAELDQTNGQPPAVTASTRPNDPAV
jgi:hypothetical protein